MRVDLGVTVRELDRETEPAYREFLRRSPHASLYASIEYRSFLQAILPGRPTYLVAEEAGHVTGALPLFVLEVPAAGTIVNSLPWYGSHGGCVLDDDERSETRRMLLDAYAARTADRDVLSATMILLPSEQPHLDVYRGILQPQAEDARTRQETPLPADGPDLDERLSATFLRKTRNLVRKALRQGFEVEVRDDDDAWAFLHRTHDVNMRAIAGRAKPWAHFAALRRELPPSMRRLYIASLEHRPVAALLLAYFGTTVEYLTPVVVEEYRSQQPLSRLIVHGMADAARAGFRAWNWGGTWATQQSLYHFKRGWGAVDTAYTYVIQSRDDGRRLAEMKDRLTKLFPYYYAYPYDRLR